MASRYDAYGCRIESAIALPTLPMSAERSSGPCIDVQFRSQRTSSRADEAALAGTAVAADGSRSWTLPGQLEWQMQRHAEHLRCEVWGEADQFAHYFIRSGVRQALAMLGQCWLRASAVSWRGRAVLIAGPGGSGKSVAAAALVQRGAGLLSDHGVALVKGASGLLALPGSQAHELWPDALYQMDGAASATTVRTGIPKSYLATRSVHGEALPVGAVLLPAYRPGATRTELVSLRGTQRLRALIVSQDGVDGVAAQLMRLATGAPVLSYARPMLPTGVDFLARLGDALAERLSGLAWAEQIDGG